MAVYRYPLPSRRYRRGRYAYRSRGTGAVPPWLMIAVAVGALAGAGAGTKAVTSHGHKAAPAAGNTAAAQVTAFARARVGRVPYAWGGTTDAGMDCSGLAQAAYASAGIGIERTSQQQWASERHVPAGQAAAGDLVFFPGSDGTPSAPGHVGIVVNPAKRLMIDAFGAGTYVRYDTYGPSASPATGLSAVVGFTDPAPVTVTAATGGGTVTLGRRLAAAYGWSSGGQWSCLYALWERESGWSATADTRVTGAGGDGPGSAVFAYGIAQARPAGKYPKAARPPDLGGRADPAAQIAWGLNDIRQVYGTPCGAWIHEQNDGWY